VRWVNYDSTYHYIEADNDTDLNFYRETTYANPEANRRNLMDTGDSFLYTFTTPGEIGYHGKPHLRGTVIVEPFT
jgi:plastocyanin